MSQAPSQDNTCGVVITFRPPPEFPRNLHSVCKEVDRVIVVDNRSSDADREVMNTACAKTGIDILFNDDNVGVAKALNQGVRWAQAQGFQWVLTFDQDTVPRTGMLNHIRTCFVEASETARIGIIGSAYVDPVVQRELPTQFPHHLLWREVDSVITSGSAMPIWLFAAIGPFREELFIDFVDIEYCLRARAAGYSVIRIETPQMEHSCGAITVHRLPWKRTGATNHTALRRYYMTRNHIVVARQYFRTEPRWVLRSFYQRLKGLILMCLFETNRAKKLKSVLLGLFDGLMGNLGQKTL